MPVPHVPDALKALEKIGRTFYKERPVELPSGHKCTLAPLGAAMEARANARVQDFRAVHFLKAVKVEQLAYAIVEVDGHRFERPSKPDGTLDEEAFESTANAKRAILNSWPEGIVTYLFNELCMLHDEVEAMVGINVDTKPDAKADEDAGDAGQPGGAEGASGGPAEGPAEGPAKAEDARDEPPAA